MRVRLRLAQYVLLAYRRQPGLPARRAQLQRNCAEGCVQLQIGVQPQDFCHIVSYAGAVRLPSFLLFDTITFIDPPSAARRPPR